MGRKRRDPLSFLHEAPARQNSECLRVWPAGFLADLSSGVGSWFLRIIFISCRLEGIIPKSCSFKEQACVSQFENDQLSHQYSLELNTHTHTHSPVELKMSLECTEFTFSALSLMISKPKEERWERNKVIQPASGGARIQTQDPVLLTSASQAHSSLEWGRSSASLKGCQLLLILLTPGLTFKTPFLPNSLLLF